MQKSFLFLALIFVTPLMSCAPRSTYYIGGQQCGFSQEFFGGRNCREEEMQSQMKECETRKTWIDRAQCKRSTFTTYRTDPNAQEFSAYIGLMIEKVKAHKMTEAEADYAIQQKKSAINQSVETSYVEQRRLDLIERGQDMQASQAANSQSWDDMMQSMRNMPKAVAPVIPAAPAYQSPVTTNCVPNGYGGVRCTSQ